MTKPNRENRPNARKSYKDAPANVPTRFPDARCLENMDQYHKAEKAVTRLVSGTSRKRNRDITLVEDSIAVCNTCNDRGGCLARMLTTSYTGIAGGQMISNGALRTVPKRGTDQIDLFATDDDPNNGDDDDEDEDL
ncbi:hypothetical protein [Mycobacteroides abscessus]|uniref:hypothetical protein n=1 Tax=Mycobacteroides abscessus TaxID=36809 RepID=UPI000927A8B2|nr:hypothetical protein [Mycobacteroides abscessus]RIS37900.1 hypothetical protein D2E71_25030 [Mycobacteroides abscessus]RIS77906.1 hypothetical protein D2E54_15240 [Mycobacteroides abscessus]SIA44518.1 Uncharacterised protein [Mycobacteroides abscessus subsp. abscessus]SIA54601.1 Uncharacterised protein [Mycobacteroides abscessus subsp. abscessus]SKQ73599.1 Uncharacterised protein [Mycobacteroides abscessus subsp. massiliense]